MVNTNSGMPLSVVLLRSSSYATIFAPIRDVQNMFLLRAMDDGFSSTGQPFARPSPICWKWPSKQDFSLILPVDLAYATLATHSFLYHTSERRRSGATAIRTITLRSVNHYRMSTTIGENGCEAADGSLVITWIS